MSAPDVDSPPFVPEATSSAEALARCRAEHGSRVRVLAAEEALAWDALASATVPSLDDASLVVATRLARDGAVQPAVVLAEQKRLRAGLEESVQTLRALLLPPSDLAAVTGRRAALEARLSVVRARVHQLRAIPGLHARFEASVALRPTLRRESPEFVRQLSEYEGLLGEQPRLEQEHTVLSETIARHHRARSRVAEVDEQLAALDDNRLAEVRALVLAGLVERGDGFVANELVRGATRQAALQLLGIRAKQRIAAHLFAHIARDTVDDAPRLVDDIERYRHDAAALDAFDRYTDVVAGASWWHAMLPARSPPAAAILRELDGTHAPRDENAKAGDVDVAAPRNSGPAGAREAPSPPAVTDDPFAVFASPLPPAGTPVTSLDDPWPTAGDTATWAAGETAQVASPPTRSFFDGAFVASAPSSPDESSVATETERASELRHAARVQPLVAERREQPGTLPHAPAFAPGARAGRYVVRGLIGKGGMAEVYLARQLGYGDFAKTVVLKRMATELRGDVEMTRMFAREAETAARISHPNIVAIFDFQEEAGELFIVMEHLEGLSLQKLISHARRVEQHLPVGIVARLVADAGRGLHAAHTTRSDDGQLIGLVHRDISPDNLFLTTSGFTKVLDFGIARRDDLTSLTAKNELKGKIPYMAPEQIQGDDVDARSDVFSLGATLYQLLTGQRPFVGTNEVAVLNAVLHRTPTPIAALRDDVPDELVAVAERMLGKRPADRPQSMGEVVDALERVGTASHDEAARFLASVLEQI